MTDGWGKEVGGTNQWLDKFGEGGRMEGRSEEESTGGGIQGWKVLERGRMEGRGSKLCAKIHGGGRMGWTDEECQSGGINWRRMVGGGWVLIVTVVLQRCLALTLLTAYCCLSCVVFTGNVVPRAARRSQSQWCSGADWLKHP